VASVCGEAMHACLKMGQRFSYRVMSLLIDLDRLDAADRQSALFGVNRTALYSSDEDDHGARDGSSLTPLAISTPMRFRRGRVSSALPGCRKSCSTSRRREGRSTCALSRPIVKAPRSPRPSSGSAAA
jgi:hypothetical protein